jgi:hypothetical protein
LIFTNADYLSWKWDSIVSSPLLLLQIRVFILFCFLAIKWFRLVDTCYSFFALVVVFAMDGCQMCFLVSIESW